MKNDYSTDTSAPGGASPEALGDDRLAAPPTARSRIGWLVVAIACALLAARLGMWQLSRAHQKTSAAELIAERGTLPALPADALAHDAGTGAAQWQRRIALHGQWDAAHTVYLMNRTMEDRSGLFVMTPLRLPDGSAVVVQRGWIEGDVGDPSKAPTVATPTGDVQVDARVAPWPAHRIELGHMAAGPLRQNLELAPFAAESGLALRPVTAIEQANSDNARDGLGRDWPAPDGNAATNYGYAVQWFAIGLVILGLYVYMQFFRRRTPSDDA